MSQTHREVISAIESRLDQPTAKGLAVAVSATIRDRILEPGDQLPPIRELAHQLAMSPTTVSAAWGTLSRAGAVQTAGRRGTRVATAPVDREGRYRQALEHETAFALDLSTGVPDPRLLPGLGRALAATTTAGTPHSYLDAPVLPELSGHLVRDWPYPPPALTVIDGAMDGLELLIRAVLRFGDRVIVEHPSFPPLLDLLETAGADVVGVPVDEDGLVPGALADALTVPARALFLQPRAHNPTGVSMSVTRRDELAALLRGRDTIVVEDDSASTISTSPDLSLGTVLPEVTVHIRSYSKSHGPDLRLAAMSGPAQLMNDVRRLREAGQGWSSRLLQQVLLNLLADPDSRAEVDAARVEYARRRTALVDALAGHGIEVGGSDGINIWVPVHDEAAALMRLATRGIGVAPGAPFDVLASDEPHIRVTVGLLDTGVAGVAEEIAVAAHTGRPGRRGR